LANKLTFIVPGLLDPVPYFEQIPAGEIPELPVWTRILSRAKISGSEKTDSSSYNFYTCHINELGLTDEFKNLSFLPIASILLRAEQNQTVLSESFLEGKWVMRVDPGIMTPDRDQLLLSDISNNRLSRSESQQLVAEINQFYENVAAESFWTLYAVSAEHWYLVSDQAIKIDTFPPENILGQSVKNYLLTGQDRQHWLRLFNEFQMILHRSPVNQNRVQNGERAVNCVWFWGNSQHLKPFLKKIIKPRSQISVFSNHDFSMGLVNLLNQTIIKLPDKFLPPCAHSGDCSSGGQNNGLYVFEQFIKPLENNDLLQWLSVLKSFELNYLQPVVKSISQGKISQLELVSPQGKRLLVNKKLLSRWWKRKIDMAVYYSRN